MNERLVRSIQLGPDGVDISYISDSDVRAEGSIYQTHTISISRHGLTDLEQLIADLEDAANDLLAAAIQGWASTLPFDVMAAREDDDDEEDDDE